MAEALAVIAVIASVAQLADLGCKLSVKLFAFSQTAATADESIRGISSDVSLTSTVLQELSLIIKADESRIVSSTAIEATKQTVAECLKIFEQLDEALEKTIGNGAHNSKGKAKRGMSTFEKFKFPFKQPKLDLLRSNLDRLKTSLSLMLQILSYARDVSSRKAAETSLAYQQHMIEALARSQQRAEARYQSLKMTLEYQKHPPSLNTFVSIPVDLSSSRGLDGLPVEPDTITAKSKSENVEPPTSSKTLVHELLLCFNLLNEVVFHHITSKTSTNLKMSDYDELDKATNNIKKQETLNLGYDPTHNFPQAAKDLTRRLEKLAIPSSYKSPFPVSTWGIQDDAEDDEDAYGEAMSEAMACRPSTPLQYIAQHHESESEILFISEGDLLRKRGKRYKKIRQTGKKHYPEDFVNPTQPLSAVTKESVIAGPFYRDAELLTTSPRSTAWSSMKSAGATTGKGRNTLRSELYAAITSGRLRFIGDDDGDNQVNDGGSNLVNAPELRPVTSNETYIPHICEPAKIDENDNEHDTTRDVVEDLLAKWTNLPPPRHS